MADDVILFEENGIKFVEKSFEEGSAKGWKFACPQVNSLQAAVATYGEEDVVEIINGYLSYNCRVKVKNLIPAFKGNEAEEKEWFAKKLTQRPDLFLFNVEEAKQWKPGTRELSEMGYFKLAKKAKEEGRLEDARKYMALAMAKLDIE